MESEILQFLKRWFKQEGDCCPKEQLDMFIINDIDVAQRECAMSYINQWLDQEYIKIVFKSGREYFVVTACGVEMLEKNDF